MHEELLETFNNILSALDRIADNNANINCEDDYYLSPGGMLRLESTSMLLLAIGESLKNIDKHTDGKLLSQYPQVNWRQAKGIRDIIAHHYFNIDAAVVLDTVKNDLPLMREVIKNLIEDMIRD